MRISYNWARAFWSQKIFSLLSHAKAEKDTGGRRESLGLKKYLRQIPIESGGQELQM